MEITRLKELAGLMSEGAASIISERNMVPFPEARRFGLYVGERGSGKLNLTFEGDRDECLAKWEELKAPGVVGRVVPLYGDANQSIVEGIEPVENEVVLESEIKVLDMVSATPEPNKEAEVTVKIPKDVKQAIETRITELKKAIEEFDENGYNSGSVKVQAVEALEQIRDNLSKQDGLVKASVYLSTLMGPIQDLIPPAVINYIAQHNAK